MSAPAGGEPIHLLVRLVGKGAKKVDGVPGWRARCGAERVERLGFFRTDGLPWASGWEVTEVTCPKCAPVTSRLAPGEGQAPIVP